MESRISVDEPETTTGLGPASERAYEQPARRLALGAERRMRPRRDVLLRRMLALADVTTVLLVSVLLALFPGGTVADALWSAVFVPVWVLLAKLAGLYDRDQRSLRHLTVDELPAIFAWALCGTVSMGLLLWLTPAGAPEIPVAIGCGIVAFIAAIVLRALARFSWRRIVPHERAVIVGVDALADQVRRKLELFPDIHVEVVDQLDHASLAELPDAPPALDGVDRVILASSSVDETLIAGLVTFCRAQKVKLSMVPPARGMFGTAVRLHHVADLPVVEYNTWDVSRSTLFLKRTIDLCVASVLLAVLAPLFLLIALAVKLDSRGPVFFKQVRAGRDGHPFRMIKFRTMCADAEEQLPQLVPFASLRDPMFKLRDDPRVTRVGRFLRRTSLDELPQFWNVLRGTMGLVGPRPEQIDLVERYRPEHRFRLVMRPGLTGPMQVFGRGELTFEERLAVEREYVENLSLGHDLRILAMTLVPVISGRGAY